MQSASERRRLVSEFWDGSIGALAIVLKCIGGFAILLFVVAGPWSVLNAAQETEVTVNQRKIIRLAQTGPRTMTGARRAFDERRQRYAATRSDRRVVVDTRD